MVVTKSRLGHRRQRAAGRGLIHALMIVVCIGCVTPLLLIFSASLTDEAALVDNGFQFIPSRFSFYAYQFLLRQGS